MLIDPLFLKDFRETQDKLSKSLHPTSHDKSVSDILGFIRDIDNVADQEDEREESDQEQEEETYDLCDLEEYPTQYEWIQANPSQNRSYNYKVNLSSFCTWDEPSQAVDHISVKIDIDVRLNPKRRRLE